jgi:hypothetical protein
MAPARRHRRGVDQAAGGAGSASGAFRQERRPILHEAAALGEEIAARIGSLGLVGDPVRQGMLYDLARMRRGLARPIPEGAAEAVRRCGAAGRSPTETSGTPGGMAI